MAPTEGLPPPEAAASNPAPTLEAPTVTLDQATEAWKKGRQEVAGQLGETIAATTPGLAAAINGFLGGIEDFAKGLDLPPAAMTALREAPFIGWFIKLIEAFRGGLDPSSAEGTAATEETIGKTITDMETKDPTMAAWLKGRLDALAQITDKTSTEYTDALSALELDAALVATADGSVAGKIETLPTARRAPLQARLTAILTGRKDHDDTYHIETAQEDLATLEKDADLMQTIGKLPESQQAVLFGRFDSLIAHRADKPTETANEIATLEKDVAMATRIAALPQAQQQPLFERLTAIEPQRLSNPTAAAAAFAALDKEVGGTPSVTQVETTETIEAAARQEARRIMLEVFGLNQIPHEVPEIEAWTIAWIMDNPTIGWNIGSSDADTAYPLVYAIQDYVKAHPQNPPYTATTTVPEFLTAIVKNPVALANFKLCSKSRLSLVGKVWTEPGTPVATVAVAPTPPTDPAPGPGVRA